MTTEKKLAADIGMQVEALNELLCKAAHLHLEVEVKKIEMTGSESPITGKLYRPWEALRICVKEVLL